MGACHQTGLWLKVRVLRPPLFKVGSRIRLKQFISFVRILCFSLFFNTESGSGPIAGAKYSAHEPAAAEYFEPEDDAAGPPTATGSTETLITPHKPRDKDSRPFSPPRDKTGKELTTALQISKKLSKKEIQEGLKLRQAQLKEIKKDTDRILRDPQNEVDLFQDALRRLVEGGAGGAAGNA